VPGILGRPIVVPLTLRPAEGVVNDHRNERDGVS
jgi:hypothetical protein